MTSLSVLNRSYAINLSLSRRQIERILRSITNLLVDEAERMQNISEIKRSVIKRRKSLVKSQKDEAPPLPLHPPKRNSNDRVSLRLRTLQRQVPGSKKWIFSARCLLITLEKRKIWLTKLRSYYLLQRHDQS